jgi:uncharacterized protein YkwD
MRRVLLALSLALAPVSVEAASCPQPEAAKQLAEEVVAWVNAERMARGLKPYKRNAKLDKSAAFQACDMHRYGYFNHSRPGGPKLGSRIKATGYKLKAANENLAYSRQHKATSAATIWRNSPPHWAAVIDPTLKEIGVSVALDQEGRVLWVMNVARPKG